MVGSQVNIDFSFCPVRETCKKTFTLKNTGELASYYEWQITPPFIITTQTGELEPESSMQVTIEFKPNDASVFNAVAIIKYGDAENFDRDFQIKDLNIQGIGKFSHLSVEGYENELDFGSVFIGRNSEKVIYLHNVSSVHSNFKIKPSETDADPYFQFSQQSGTVPPGKKLPITVFSF